MCTNLSLSEGTQTNSFMCAICDVGLQRLNFDEGDCISNQCNPIWDTLTNQQMLDTGIYGFVCVSVEGISSPNSARYRRQWWISKQE